MSGGTNLNPLKLNKMETRSFFSLNTGGNCMLYAMFTGKKDNAGCEILSVWDDFTGNLPVNVTLSKYGQSFEMSDGSKFFLSEFNEETFFVHGAVTYSNAGGFLVQLSDCGEMARLLDAYGSDAPKISEWFPIEYITDPDDEEGDSIPTIDPEGWNIRLDNVVRM
jgi:hypothetical protein